MLKLSRNRYIDPTDIAAIDDFGGATFSDDLGQYHWVARLKNGNSVNLTDEDYDWVVYAHDEIIRAWFLSDQRNSKSGGY